MTPIEQDKLNIIRAENNIKQFEKLKKQVPILKSFCNFGINSNMKLKESEIKRIEKQGL